MLIHATSEKKLGPTIPLHCPGCLTENVDSQVYAMVDQVLFLFVVPLHTKSTLFISCPKCRRTFKPLIPLEDFSTFPVEARGRYLKEHISVFQVLLALAAFFICWIPVVGVVIAGIALLVNWQAMAWLRLLSGIALAGGVLSTGIFLLLSV